MPSHLKNIVIKELREIARDPRLLIGMIIVPMLMFPLMGAGVRVAFEATAEELRRMEVGFVNQDYAYGNHTFSDQLYGVMTDRRLVLRNSTTTDLEESLQWARTNGLKTVVVVPANFSEDIWSGSIAQVWVYQVVQYFGMGESIGTTLVASAVDAFNRQLAQDRATVVEASVVKGVIINAPPDAVINTVFSSSAMVPIAISIVIVLAAQLAATSVAMEKEQKTLEVLLTLPLRRTTILVGKLSGVILVSALATIAILLSFGYYMASFTVGGTTSIDLSAAGMAPDSVGFALMAASLFLSLIAVLALAVLMAAYTKDVRSAQSLLGVLFLPVFIPAFLLMFAPVELLPTGLQAAIYAIPFSYPTLAAKAMYTKEYTVVALGIVYQVAFTVVVLALAARLFSSEKIMTARLRFKRGGKSGAGRDTEM